MRITAVVELPFSVWQPIELRSGQVYEVYRNGSNYEVTGDHVQVHDSVRVDEEWKRVISFQ
jgi:hypothetical protein